MWPQLQVELVENVVGSSSLKVRDNHLPPWTLVSQWQCSARSDSGSGGTGLIGWQIALAD